jgi:hypothetical protein
MYHRVANVNVNERQSLVWEELSRSRHPKMRAGHFYEAPHTTSCQSALYVGRRTLTWPVLVAALTVAVVIITLAMAF